MAGGSGNKPRGGFLLCLYCAAKMEDAYELKPVGPVTLGTCEWCGNQTIIQKLRAYKKSARPEGRAGDQKSGGV